MIALVLWTGWAIIIGAGRMHPEPDPASGVGEAMKSDSHKESPGKVYCINAPALVFHATEAPPPLEKATFAAGCFWGVQAAFDKVKGVIATRAGYTGGRLKSPTYEDVCTGRTGHAEAVEVTFDPRVISYEELLDVFWSVHDPTTPDRQGVDVGSQYRSAIFYHTSSQAKAAAASRSRLEKKGVLRNRIVTEIEPAGEFYEAEEYHQKYYEGRGIEPTCHIPPRLLGE